MIVKRNLRSADLLGKEQQLFAVKIDQLLKKCGIGRIPGNFDLSKTGENLLPFSQAGETRWTINNISYPGKNKQLIGYRSTLPVGHSTWQVYPLPESEEAEMLKITNFIRGIERLTSKLYKFTFIQKDHQLFISEINKLSLSSEGLCQVINSELENSHSTFDKVLLQLSEIDFNINNISNIENKNIIKPVARGASAGSLISIGEVTFLDNEVKSSSADRRILVKQVLLPEDIKYLRYVDGVIALAGGVSSHMAVIARSMGKAFLCISEGKLTPAGLEVGNIIIRKGDMVTVDEADGQLYLGKAITRTVAAIKEKATILSYANSLKRNNIYINVDHAAELRKLELSHIAGIGLCRSENQLIHLELINEFRSFILANTRTSGQKALKKIAQVISKDISSMLKLLDGKAFHYRLIDPAVNEILKINEEDRISLCNSLECSSEELSAKIGHLIQSSDIFGIRGVRWGIMYEEFYRMQIDCLFEQLDIFDACKIDIRIILPLVAFKEEVSIWKGYVDSRNELYRKTGNHIQIGCMIETPRATLIANELAAEMDFFAIGSNDLTQAIFCLSRDAVDTAYLQKVNSSDGLGNPFIHIDKKGLGVLLYNVTKAARKVKPSFPIHICGEHASNPKNLEMLLDLGIGGVSCTPSAVDRVMLQSGLLGTRVLKKEKGSITSKGKISEVTEQYLNKVIIALQNEESENGIKLAYEWAKRTGSLHGLSNFDNWKFFKRDLVIRYFEKLEAKRFAKGWNPKDVEKYVFALRDNTDAVIRYSLFPEDIACQASSDVFDRSLPEEVWKEKIQTIDRNQPMEVFPQQDKSNMSFRIFFSRFAITFEIGLGQAIDVFWKKTASIKKVVAQWNYFDDQLKFETSTDPENRELKDHLTEMIGLHKNSIINRPMMLCDDFGLEWLALEGYFDQKNSKRFIIVDIDLPFDIAFYTKSNKA